MQVEQRDPQSVLAMKFHCELDDLPQRTEKALATVYQYARQHKAEVCGPPFVRHSTLNLSERDFVVGVPVKSETPGDGTVIRQTLPGGSVATTTHVGPHEDLELARRTLITWARDNDLRLVGGPWEVYLSDPMLQPDVTQLETMLCQAVSR